MQAPTIKQNQHGVWEIRWSRNGRSHRKSTRTTNYDEAQRDLAAFLMNEAKCDDERTINEHMDDYDVEHVQARVADVKRQHEIMRVLRKFFGRMRPSDLTANIIQKYILARNNGTLNGRQAGNSTVRRELNCLIACLNHQVKQRRLLASDIPHIHLPEGAPPKDLWLSDAECQQLLMAANHEQDRLSRVFRFTMIALETASRKTAILRLKWDDIDWEHGMIRFDTGGMSRIKRRVPVPISDSLMPVLVRAYHEQRTMFVLDTDSSIQHPFERACRRAYETTGNRRFLDVTPHTLRHTWATQAARAGVSMYEIAGVLGDTIATVTRNYLHHNPEHLRNVVNFRQTA